jgi:hypothetical protein
VNRNISPTLLILKVFNFGLMSGHVITGAARGIPPLGFNSKTATSGHPHDQPQNPLVCNCCALNVESRAGRVVSAGFWPILFISVLKLPNAYHVASTHSTLQPLPCDSAFPAYFRQDLWFVRVRLLTLAVNNSWIKFKPSYPA